MMINKNHILISLLAAGLMFFWSAGQFFDWGIISANGYYIFYAAGLLAWSIRFKLTAISIFDKMVSNIAFWLCLFNVLDELLSKNPCKPYHPYLITIIVIFTSIIIYVNGCKKKQKD